MECMKERTRRRYRGEGGQNKNFLEKSNSRIKEVRQCVHGGSGCLHRERGHKVSEMFVFVDKSCCLIPRLRIFAKAPLKVYLALTTC